MSRQQSVLRNTVGYMLKNIDNQATNGEEKSKPEVIKLGLDLHARQVGSVATLELRRSLAIASAKLDRHRAEQTKYEAME